MGEDGKIIKGDTFAQTQEEKPKTLNMADFSKLMASQGFKLSSLADINDDTTYTIIKDILLLAVMSENDLFKFAKTEQYRL